MSWSIENDAEFSAEFIKQEREVENGYKVYTGEKLELDITVLPTMGEEDRNALAVDYKISWHEYFKDLRFNVRIETPETGDGEGFDMNTMHMYPMNEIIREGEKPFEYELFGNESQDSKASNKLVYRISVRVMPQSRGQMPDCRSTLCIEAMHKGYPTEDLEDQIVNHRGEGGLEDALMKLFHESWRVPGLLSYVYLAKNLLVCQPLTLKSFSVYRGNDNILGIEITNDHETMTLTLSDANFRCEPIDSPFSVIELSENDPEENTRTVTLKPGEKYNFVYLVLPSDHNGLLGGKFQGHATYVWKFPYMSTNYFTRHVVEWVRPGNEDDDMAMLVKVPNPKDIKAMSEAKLEITVVNKTKNDVEVEFVNFAEPKTDIAYYIVDVR